MLFVSAGVAHGARNRTEVNGAELATYMVETGKLLLVPTEVSESGHKVQEESR